MIKLKDWIDVLLVAWGNLIATIALIVSIREKKKTAKRRTVKSKRKR